MPKQQNSPMGRWHAQVGRALLCMKGGFPALGALCLWIPFLLITLSGCGGGGGKEGGSVSPPPAQVTMSKLPDTGQDKCYNDTGEIACPAAGQAYSGQDAQYTVNLPSYTVDATNGVVTDNNTGLMWQREDDNTTRTWASAISYCENLSLAGYTDWRLPSTSELIGLVKW